MNCCRSSRARHAAEGRLQGMVRYLLTTEHAQDGQETDALAQLTDAVLAALRRSLEN
jgi:hypothetical protein